MNNNNKSDNIKNNINNNNIIMAIAQVRYYPWIKLHRVVV